MFFSSQFVIFYSFVLTSINECINNNEIKCEYLSIGRDQSLITNEIQRHKRFVLFPEYKLWLNDWRYLNHPNKFIYWISNFYPNKIHSNYVQSYIHHIVNNINKFINNKISSIGQATSIDKANFHYNFFNYEICPTDDSLSTTINVQSIESLIIYSRQVIKDNRYRAHGGILLNSINNSTISTMKFNIHHTFLIHQDFQYDPVEYKCNSDGSHCFMDLYAVMLHETLHGFGIEHTEKKLANKNFLAVMHLYASRIMCHDDIRAIRMVYGLSVKRINSIYDDTCRRDFPLNPLQKLINKCHRLIIFYIYRIGLSISFILFLLTIIYILLIKHYLHRNDYDQLSSPQSIRSQQTYDKIHKPAINAFLWHNDYLNN
ncbi:unnamed protein product [Rotaria sordida]|uniref:Peptidase M10 metallopeptidase domain-containing protein n=1 Tax=Rotaria sordida TaxID=392033 RepID=A0A814R9V3_9BILA|nr:unnamed protein product [Rotaria sordida]CAF1130586.1 unnamed protein product [Rotaria sordida]CAF1177637.1 unnamed protein product [Rotaria sordida]CAF1406780.1 unnamed protein product [Rotaria sordida]CAF3801954.1 unnamed protein product [Rotaria sordida]